MLIPGRDVDLGCELARVKEASDAFHDSIKDLPRPEFMDVRDDPWAFGDRVAWEAAEPEGDDETLDVIRRLRDHLAAVRTPSQVVHGDILPNVSWRTDFRQPSSTGRPTSGRSGRPMQWPLPMP